MHDVNNALNPIMAAAYLLEANAENPGAVRDYAVRIAQGGRDRRRDRGARRTLHPPGAAAGRHAKRSVDLSRWSRRSRRDDAPALGRARQRRHDPSRPRAGAPGAMIRGIAGELREALLNLVQNALDAMAGGGTLGIRDDGRRRREVALEVRDTGIGMSAEVRERAFEPFFTTKGVNGTGLGLAEVYGIVKRHRGQAEIESMPGVGHDDSAGFPARDAGARAGAVDRRRAHASPRRVLLVEDHPDSREFMQALLESDGHRSIRRSGRRRGDGARLRDEAAPRTKCS